MQLGAAARARGYRLDGFDCLASTNDEAMHRAREGDPGPLWITAAAQTAGRGRLGRSWVSPRGNLHASLLLLDAAAPAHLPELGFVCGVALAQTLAGFAGARIQLKWPNDALLDGAKVAGILLESARVSAATACVAGIGVNCCDHPRNLAYAATDLGAAGLAVAAGEVFEALSDHLADWLEVWDRGAGFGRVRAAWLDHAAGLGQEITVATPRGRVGGRFLGLDARGRLELEAPDGRIAIDAGDVFLATTTAPAGAVGRN